MPAAGIIERLEFPNRNDRNRQSMQLGIGGPFIDYPVWVISISGREVPSGRLESGSLLQLLRRQTRTGTVVRAPRR